MTRKEIEFLPVEEVFDGKVQAAKYEIKRFTSKFTIDLVKSLSPESSDS